MARQMTAAKPSPSAERPRQMNGAQTLVEALRREGVEVLFGPPGGASLPIYDALYDAQDIRHILVRHEQVAAHAAVGYARASGRVGVCTATSGPGATNLITGITDAMMDSAPIVAITGQVPRPVIGNDAFQEADVTGITMPITKYNTLVMRAMDIPKAVRMAFYLAKTGRPGPRPGRGGAFPWPPHRPPQGLRPPRPFHPHRHRPGRDGEEQPGAHPDRGRRQTGASRARPAGAAAED